MGRAPSKGKSFYTCTSMQSVSLSFVNKSPKLSYMKLHLRLRFRQVEEGWKVEGRKYENRILIQKQTSFINHCRFFFCREAMWLTSRQTICQRIAQEASSATNRFPRMFQQHSLNMCWNSIIILTTYEQFFHSSRANITLLLTNTSQTTPVFNYKTTWNSSAKSPHRSSNHRTSQAHP